jgi:hypothetical protein
MKPAKMQFMQTRNDGSNIPFKQASGLTINVCTNDTTVNKIAVEVASGWSANRKPREQELISITFADGKVWSGDFSHLRQCVDSFECLATIVKETIQTGDQTPQFEEAFSIVRRHNP